MSYWISKIPIEGTTTVTGIVDFDENGNYIYGFGYMGTAGYSHLFKYDLNGSLVLSASLAQQYGAGGFLRLSDGYLIGLTNSSNDGLIGKVNTDFVLQASPKLNLGIGAASYNGAPVSMHETSGPGYIITCGAVLNENSVIKLDSSFSTTPTWSYAINAGTVYFHTSVQDSSGNIYIFGTITNTVVSNVLIKLNSSGVEQWARLIKGSLSSAVTTGSTYKLGRLGVDSSGNTYVCGTSETGTKTYVLSYDSSGTLRWQRWLTISNLGFLPCMSTDSNGNSYVFFLTNATTYTLVKYDSSGTVVFKNKFTFTNVGPSGSLFNNNYGIKVTDTALMLSFRYSSYSSDYIGSLNVLRLPLDGSGTGTYGGITYGTSSITEAAGSMVTISTTMTTGGTVTVASGPSINTPQLVGGFYNVS